jgi:hypothetical protein
MTKQVWRLAIPAMALVFLWPLVAYPAGVLFPPKSDYTDLLVTHWPDALWLRRAVLEYHELPLWNPAILGGQPFAADPLAGVWYPPNWLMLIPGVPVGVIFNVLFVAHLMFGGWGMLQFLYTGMSGGEASWKLNRGAALVGVAAFMGLPKWAAHLGAGHVTLCYAVMWTPWLLMGVRRAASDGKPKSAALTGATLAATFLADVRWALYAGLLAAAYWLWLTTMMGRRQAQVEAVRRTASNAAVFAAFFVTLSAILALPFLEFRSQSIRASLTLADAGAYSLRPRYLIGAIIPNLGGFHEWMTYLGFLPLALAASSLTLRPRRASPARGSGLAGEWPFWAGVAVVGALMSLGTYTPLYGLLLRLIPFLGWLRVPPRAWFLVGLAVAVLAATGARALAGGVTGRAARVYRMAAVGGAALTVSLTLGAWAIAGQPIPSLVVLAVVATAGLALLALAASKRIAPGHFLTLAALLVVADLGYVDSTLMRVKSVEEAFAGGSSVAQAIRASLQSTPPARVYSPSYSLPQHVAAAYALEQADGVNPLQLATMVGFMAQASGVPETGYSVTLPPFASGQPARDNAAFTPDAHLLGLLGVHYVAAEFDLASPGLRLKQQFGTTRLYENLKAGPFAWMATRNETASDAEAALRAAANGETAVEGSAGLVGDGRLLPAEVTARGINFLTVAAQADEPGLLVTAEVDYPGWQATVDGVAAPIVRTDGLLRGVLVPAGTHTVEFRFRPRSVLAGAIITGLGLIALIVVVAWPGERRVVGDP